MSTLVLLNGRIIRCLLFFAVLLTAFYPVVTHTQNVTGAIQGTVLDASGSAVPNAEITVTNTNTGVARTTTATADGLFSVPSLQPGVYTVEGKAQGFSPVQVKDITVNSPELTNAASQIARLIQA